MPPELSKAALTIAFWITLLSAGCVLLVERGTAEYVVSVMALGIGITFLAVVLFFIRRSTR